MDVFSTSLWEVNNTDTHAKTSQWAKSGNPTALNTTEVTKNEIILKNKILLLKISISDRYTLKFIKVEAIQYKQTLHYLTFSTNQVFLDLWLYTQCIPRT